MRLRYLIWFLLVLGVIWRLVIGYYGLVVYQYPVPPGDDAVRHLTIISWIIEAKNPFIHSPYPLIFHWLIAGIASLVSINPLIIINWLSPLLLAIPILIVYVVVKRMFNEKIALLASLILAFNSTFPLLGYGDGNYPDMIANGIFFPLAALFLVKTFTDFSGRNLLYLSLSILGVLFTHHLSSIYLLALAVVYLMAALMVTRHYYFHYWIVKIILKISLVGAVLFVIAWLAFLKDSLWSFISQLVKTGGLEGIFGAYWSTPTPLAEYPLMLGYLPVVFGILGLCALVVWQKDKPTVQKLSVLCLMVWIGVLFIFSRLSAGGLPGRALRELALPLSISAGFFVFWIIDEMKNLMLLNINGLFQGVYRFPDLFDRMVWFTREDLAKTDAIFSHAQPDEVTLSNPASPYLSLISMRRVEIVPNYPSYQLADWARYVRDKGIEYVFIGKKPKSDPSETAYPFFADFDEKTKILEKIYFKDLIYEFRDGSQFYRINDQTLEKVLSDNS
jgi:hypothetical protein